jgi:hypothetical protein
MNLPTTLSSQLILALLTVSPTAHALDFNHDIVPILREHCAECHSGDKKKGGLSFNTRAALLEGSENGEVLTLGNADDSFLIEAVTTDDEDFQMPPKGDRLSPIQVALLKSWIDAKLPWQDGFTFSDKPAYTVPLKPRRPNLPGATDDPHPVDRFLAAYATDHQIKFPGPVDNAAFLRRASLDLIGLLPTPEQVAAFTKESSIKNPASSIRPQAALVDALLADNKAYAEHWMTFWNDALRNAYKGTGFIDGGRSQITGWLFDALYHNKPYHQFVRELIDPPQDSGAQGFVNGIKWRGNVNESQRREMQAAQNISQVFLGTNIKCASCHDSFINDWKLADAYAMATIFADDESGPLEHHRCDKPNGNTASPGFLFPELGPIDAPDRAGRQQQLAALMTHQDNGRLARTIVNRLWRKLMGRGLVEPVDDMDARPWYPDLLDWLAADLAEHNYDLKHTLRTIATSNAYRQHTQPTSKAQLNSDEYEFQGPIARPLTAEQYLDAVSQVTGQWPAVTDPIIKGSGRAQGAQLAAIVKVLNLKEYDYPAHTRAVFTFADPVQRALGRPNREQVVTDRPDELTTLQALELTSNNSLNEKINAGATALLAAQGKTKNPKALINTFYQRGLSRPPSKEEQSLALKLLTQKPTPASIADLLWAILMLPEFQLNH